MNEPATVTLGGREFPVAPLTLGQMKQAGPAFTRIGIDTPHQNPIDDGDPHYIPHLEMLLRMSLHFCAILDMPPEEELP